MRQLLRRLQIGGERSKHKSRGQSLVEFALVLPVLMFLLLMTIDFGRVFLGWVTINNAARIAANYAATAQPPLVTAQETQYRAIVGRETSGLNCTLPTPIPDPTFPSGTSVGGQAVVTLSCAFQPITPFISAFFPGGVVNVGATANFPIRAGVLANIGGSGGSTTYVAPNQDFTVSPSSGVAPLIVNVTLGTQLGGGAQTYLWNFGDATTSNLPNPPAHTYNSAATYTITLREGNPGGMSPIYSHTVTVTDPLTAPVAGFYGTVPSPCTDSGAPNSEACGGTSGANIFFSYNPAPTVFFTNTSTNATGATYAWNFGDPGSGSANTSTLASPTHTYASPGSFTVSLTVTTAGGTNTATRANYVNLGCIVPSFIGVSSANGSGNAGSLWTSANFLASNLFFWQTNGTYTTSNPTGSNAYVIGQQNPGSSLFLTAVPVPGNKYACTTQGRVAPKGVTPAP
jgi:PKD repeat protein